MNIRELIERYSKLEPADYPPNWEEECAALDRYYAWVEDSSLLPLGWKQDTIIILQNQSYD
jgi:hypothetical protein